MVKLDEELKISILQLPAKEKDKLLLRLVARDEKLVRRLIFELLEHGATKDERAENLRMQIARSFEKAKSDSGMTPGYLLLDLRHWNARINEHVHATSDKPGEVILAAFMLAEAFRQFREMLGSFPSFRSKTLAPYVVKRTAAIIKKAGSLHEDYALEYKRDLQEVLRNIWSFPPMAVLAKDANLPQKWER